MSSSCTQPHPVLIYCCNKGKPLQMHADLMSRLILHELLSASSLGCHMIPTKEKEMILELLVLGFECVSKASTYLC